MNIGYARTSTTDQNTNLQIDALNNSGCKKIFQEQASGAKRDRPQLKLALEYAREGDTIIVWKLDRLARSIKQLIVTIENLEERKIGFRSLTENIDTTTNGGKLIFHIFAALAEFERGIIKERTIAGLEAARARGKVGGRPPSLTSDDIIAAKALLTDSNITVKEIANRLGVSISTLYKHLPAARSIRNSN